ncbi:MAG: RNA polymerase sigma factor [Bacteroidales bacterium]|jgi:RNA polymerase sigma-70 factor (ECF subfamily)|nr:RNA polymerase sigma factor [Bacteroidales bacterium]
MKPEEEKYIIESVKRGDTELFNRIVEAYSPKILSVVRSVISCNEDAEEIAQDVFVKAFFSLGKFRGESSLSTWLYRIAYNMSLSKARVKRRSFVTLDNIKLSYDDHLNEERSELIDKERKYLILNNILESIEPSERVLISLFYNHHKSIREISEITGIGESNVKVKLHRIKRRLIEIANKKMEVRYG